MTTTTPARAPARHRAAVCEDDPDARERICNIVASLDHEPIPLGSLQEIKQFLETGEDPCYWLQDMQMPHVPHALVHEKVGDSAMRLARGKSRGPFGWPVIVLTGFRSDPEFVMSCARAEADEFVEKKNLAVLADKILAWLRIKGRADHASCAACNVRSRPPRVEVVEGAAAAVVARLYSHEQAVGARAVCQAEVDEILERRRELHLFLDATKQERDGFRGGKKDLDGRYQEVFLPRSYADAIVELVSTRQGMRPYAMKSLRAAGKGLGPTGGARLLERARKLIDVNTLVNGRVSPRKWRAIHTTGDKDMRAFWFNPGEGMRWAVLAGAVEPHARG